MGGGASKKATSTAADRGFYAPGMQLEQPTTGLAVESLSRLLGVKASSDERACTAALEVITACFAAKFNGRAPTKPIDLTHLVTADRKIDPKLVADLEAAVDASSAAAILAALESVHLRALPKLGIGTFNLHKRCPNTQPLKVAYDHGCRLFPFVDPVPGPMAAMNPVGEYGNDLRDVDLSAADTFVSSALACFTKDGATREMLKGQVRRSFDALVEQLGPLRTGEGQPLLDGYMLVFPTPYLAMPSKKPLVDAVSVGEVWEEMEALVDAGLVRSLGVSNFSPAQLELLLQKARIRPSFVQQERHVLNPIREFTAFCGARKLPLMAAVPLATGEVLDSKHLAHDTLTPAQAALHWNIVSNVAVIPGADTIEQIIENCQTMQLLDAPPVAPPEPSNPLRKVHPVWPACHGYFAETCTAADAATFVEDARGYLVCAADPAKMGDAVMAATLNASEKALLREVSTVVCALPTGAGCSPHDKRSAIDAAIRGLGGGVAQPPSPLREANGATAHTFAPRAAGNLTRMAVVSFADFVAAGSIPRRSCHDARHAHVHVDAVPAGAKVLFFSQRWLTPRGDPASPDDAQGTKYAAVVGAARAWAAQQSVAEADVYLWIDYASVDQDDVSELTRGVNSLGLYVCSADAFITIEHESYFDRGWCLMECLYADTSKVPRYLMTKGGALRQMCAEDRLDLKRPNQGSFTVESDRHFMRNLEATAQTISSQMERGFETVKHCDSPAKAGGSNSPLKGGMSPLKASKYAASLRSHANMAELLG